VAEDRKEPPKPAPGGAKPAAAAASPAKPGAGAVQAAAKAELARRADPDGAKPDRDELPSAERAMLRLGRALMLLSGVILLFAIVGAGLLGAQLVQMQGQLRQMQAASRQNDEALAAATRIADAAKRSADAIPDMERAYLLLDASATSLPKSVAAASPARLAFRNYGRTPAAVGTVAARYSYVAGAPAKIEAPKANLPLALTVAEGGAAGPYDVALDANDQDLARAQKGEGAIVVQAVVRYADLFGEPHETGVCFAFRFDAGAFAPCADAGLTYHN